MLTHQKDELMVDNRFPGGEIRSGMEFENKMGGHCLWLASRFRALWN